MPSGPPAKCLLLLLDGLADRAQAALGGRTPLMAAATPFLDSLAAQGACGLWHAASPGLALPSEEAHYALMGYGPELFPGRGYLEALGHGIPLADGEVALCAHLALARRDGDQLVMIKKKPRLPEEEAAALLASVARAEFSGGAARFARTGGPSGVLVLTGRVSRHISDSDPMLPGRPVLRPEPWVGHQDDPAARTAARLLAEYTAWSHRVLASHPVNAARAARSEPQVLAVVAQRAGQAVASPPLARRWGLEVLSLASAPIYRGVFLALGAAAELLPENPDPAADLAAKLERAAADLDRFDLVHVHTKAPDEAAHEKDPEAKRRVIEALDMGLARTWTALAARGDVLTVVTGDHATPSDGDMVHGGEPSPLLVHGSGVWCDGVTAFNETAAAAGCLGGLRGSELMLSILAWLDRAKLSGLRDGPHDLPYYPGPRRALKLTGPVEN